MKLKELMTFRIAVLTAIALAYVAMNNHASGQGRNEEVTIIAPYIPSVGDASKIPFRPEITPEETGKPEMQYNYITKSVETRIQPEPVDPVRVSEGKQEDLYRNYAKLGFGNYWTPYLELMAGSIQSEKNQFGVRLKHHSSQGGIKGYGDDAFSKNMISVGGRTFLKNHTLSASLGYNRDVVHFYGYPADSFPGLDIDEDQLKQRYQNVRARMAFGSNYTSGNKLDHAFSLAYDFFSDRFDARESHFGLLAEFYKNLPGKSSDFQHALALDIKMDYLSFRDSIDAFKPLYIEIKPVYHFSIGQYAFRAGLHVDILKEPSLADSNLTVAAFPTLGAEITVIEDKLRVFAGLEGELTVNSFRSLAEVNPYLTSTPFLASTDQHLRIRGGINGNAGGVNFIAEASYAFVTNMPLFVTDTSVALDNKFLVIYDDLSVLNVKGSLGYTRIANLRTRLTASYFHYIADKEEKAWHMPNAEVSLDAAYLLREKYTFRASALLLGTRYARAFDADMSVVPLKLKTAFDLSIGFDYRINRMITAFVDGNNLLNQHYQRWYNYPVQGLQVMLGAKFSF